MDGTRFDGVTRAWATGQTRRHVMQWLGGGAFAGLLGHLGIKDAGAACVKLGKKGCKGPRNRKCCTGAVCKVGTRKKEGRCVCKDDLTQCGAECVDTTTDGDHCGACDQRCDADEECRNGVCTCFVGHRRCGNRCIDTRFDNNNCGACDNVCGTGETCRNSVCVGPLGCQQGAEYCGANPGRCPDSADPNCHCTTDVQGVLRCVDPINSTCSTCTSNAECGSNRVCIPANNAGPCDCPANACASPCVS